MIKHARDMYRVANILIEASPLEKLEISYKKKKQQNLLVPSESFKSFAKGFGDFVLNKVDSSGNKDYLFGIESAKKCSKKFKKSKK